MIESMACGTPVLASRRGSVPEVIDDGVTGVIVDDWDAVEDALERASQLQPEEMRNAVERRFSPAGMVADYIKAYEGVMTDQPDRTRSSRTVPERRVAVSRSGDA